MNIKRLVPDTITSCNLLCGAVAVIMATEGAFLYAFLFILLGAFFDFFDGMSARLLKVPSALGIQMDSLADDEHVRYCDHPWQMTASRSVMVISQRMCAWSVKLSLTDEALFLGQLAE